MSPELVKELNCKPKAPVNKVNRKPKASVSEANIPDLHHLRSLFLDWADIAFRYHNIVKPEGSLNRLPHDCLTNLSFELSIVIFYRFIVNRGVRRHA